MITVETHDRICSDLHQQMRALIVENERLRRRLTDDEVGRIWFEAKIPGLTENDARRLIRMTEAHRELPTVR